MCLSVFESGLTIQKKKTTHLEVAADDEQVDAVPATDLARLGDGRIYGVEGAMAL